MHTTHDGLQTMNYGMSVTKVSTHGDKINTHTSALHGYSIIWSDNNVTMILLCVGIVH